MLHTHVRTATRSAVLVAAGLVLAAPAMASEGPTGPQLPNPLSPPTFTPPGAGTATPPSRPAGKRAVRPRVVKARVTPRRVRAGRTTRLRLSVSGAVRVRVVVKGVKRGRATTRTVTVRGDAVDLRLPSRSRAGRYRVTVVAVDAAGNRSRSTRRSFTVVRRAR
jgi:hypothetical protein